MPLLMLSLLPQFIPNVQAMEPITVKVVDEIGLMIRDAFIWLAQNSYFKIE